MAKLEHSEALGRPIRVDDVAELGESTWRLLRIAIESGNTDEALELLDYGTAVDKGLLDALISYVDDMLTFLADRLGEDEAFEVVRRRYLPRVVDFLATSPGAREAMRREVENQRAHYGEVTVTEDEEKFTVHCDPCGTGGRLRRTKDVARTREPHPWSWGKKDMPYYCSHCSLMWEIIPIEQRGHPISVFLPPERDEDPCLHLYYKRPQDIPEEYYTRVGKTKPDFGTGAEGGAAGGA